MFVFFVVYFFCLFEMKIKNSMRGLFRCTSLLNIVALIAIAIVPFIFSEKAEAAILQQVWVRPDRLLAATATGGLVCVKTAVIDVTESNVSVTFPTGFTVSETLGDWGTAVTQLPSGATAWPGIGEATAASDTTKVVTFPSDNLTANTLYCFRFDETPLTTSSAGNNKTGTVATGGNSSPYALSIVSNDQIVVSATVPAIFSFSLDDTADTLGTLSTSIVSSTGVVARVETNAASGWVAWVKSANAALNSSSTGASIATAGTVDDTPSDLDSVTGYVLDVDITLDGSGTGTVTQDPGYGDEYAGADTTQGGTLSTAFQPIAVSSGTTDGDTLTLYERVKITALQRPASDYTDTLTVVAAGRF